MKTIRVLLGLTGLLTILAIATTPAAAEFQANQPETTQGPYQIAGTPPVFTSGTAEVKCAELRNGQWHIQTKFTKIGKDAEGATKITQDPTKTGAHQQITGEFTKCIALGTLAASVNTSCSLQIEQSKPSGFTGAVKSQCIISIPAGSCTIFIDPSTANAQLKTVNVINITGGKEDLSEVKGITSTVTGAGCAVGGITANKENKFIATGIAHSQKVI